VADPTTTPVLWLQNVTKDFGEEVVTRVLHGIDMRIDVGELVALVGPSGSGKSTLLNILGLLERPTGGRVVIQGQETADLDDAGLTRLRLRALGFVFQFHHLLPAFSALENVIMPLVVLEGRTSRSMRARGEELLAAVGLADRADARINQLSGGQQQRVAIARALALDPPLVLADEPTGNLDLTTSHLMFDLLRRFHTERRTSFLIVTHDEQLAGRCDRIIRLVDGRIVSDESRVAGAVGPG